MKHVSSEEIVRKMETKRKETNKNKIVDISRAHDEERQLEEFDAHSTY